MRKEFENILSEHNLYGVDVEETLYAVQDMVEAVVNKLKEEEPYATNAIERLKITSQEIINLINVYA